VHAGARRILAWVTIARGGLALGLGLALLLQREGTTETIATFMGMYWLIGGILTLTFHREIRAVRARRLPLLAGAFSVVAGGAVLIRGAMQPAAPSLAETFVLVGILILVTGLTNAASGVRSGTSLSRERTRESLILGLLEITLGTLLVLIGGQPGPGLLLATTAWAFTAGIILLGQGLRMRRNLV
jgi:uncharacterized membrane protein HdeD (DUF308 family)